LDVEPVILRLSGWVQTTDKQALREIVSQLFQQVGSSLLVDSETLPSHATSAENDGDNPFLDRPTPESAERGMHIPPSSQLYTLIPILLTLNRPVIVVLDAFDLFALHPRQSLLYCLLDAVQSCRATSGNHGIAVIGATSRLDTIHLLEKRVKSRFSGRIIRTAPPNDLKHWIAMSKSILQVPIALKNVDCVKEWHQKWSSSVEEFLSDSRVLDVFKESFSLSRDPKILRRLLVSIFDLICVLYQNFLAF
jgi:origin recognition complex subunit 4